MTAPAIEEGAGKAGCPPHPRPPCVKKARGRNHRYGRSNPAFPAQWFDGLIPRSPRGPGFLAPVAARKQVSRNLAPASGCQDHTALPYTDAFSKDTRQAWYGPPQLWRKRVSIARLATPPRPSHPTLHVRDDREASLR